ncbi:MAG: hypothetical protein ACRC4L_01800, partial [Mycoplasma sp.]
MKISKSTKKIVLFGSLLLVTTAIASTVAVACSNTSNPEITTAAIFNVIDEGSTGKDEAGVDKGGQYTVNRSSNGSISISPSIVFSNEEGEDKYYSAYPSFSSFESASVTDQKAATYFAILNYYTFSLHNLSIQYQDFLTASTTGLATLSNEFDREIQDEYKLKDLSAALSTTVNEGKDTARLGLRSIDLNLGDMYKQIESEKYDYFKKVEDAAKPTDEDLTSTIKVSDVKFNYEWWSTDKKNKVHWKGSNWNINDQNLMFWKVFLDNGYAAPSASYSLSLEETLFQWKNVYKTDDADLELEKYYSTGETKLIQEESGATIYT